MELYNLIAQPFLLGLSTGVFCAGYCLPFVASFMVLEKRKNQEDFQVIFKILFGRLLGYFCFGGLFIFLSEQINNQVFDLIMRISLMILGLILALYSLNLITKNRKICPAIGLKNKTPLAMGFFMAFRICPPVLMALMQVFTLHNWLNGLIYFLVFFLATSIYFLPLGFLGFLNEKKEFQLVGRISALIIGILFFAYNFLKLFYG